ncbi:hypothetical protein [Rhodopirellula europaea]|uniref:hypothetical protein n=1 Tax=Rhodopirellula europaea TaxID=1263866 RepID=UPI003D2E720A|nr:hypothetical protein [bacterium]
MRFTLTQILTTVLIVALGFALVGTQIRHQRRIASLEHALYQARSDIAIAEYGSASCLLLELHPSFYDDPSNLRFLNHEIAYSILMHWEREAAIDAAVDTPGHSKAFAKRALGLLECTTPDDFVRELRSRFSIYPDDELGSWFSGSPPGDLLNFKAFLQAAFELNEPDGG